MTTQKIRIESDFADYYDYLATKGDAIVKYIRNYNQSLPKGKAMAELKKMGIQTIELGTVEKLAFMHKNLVVYTDAKKHKGEGKLLMESRDAVSTYPNRLASPYYTETNGVTNKFLQIGSRRFRLVIENEHIFKNGKLLEFTEIQPSYNYKMALPIFSIDYISTQYGMIAVDFNTVEDLSSLGIQNILKPNDIINEIYYSLVAYNKI